MSFEPSPELIARIRPIKLLLLDVDGILTDCRIILDAAGEWKRFFSIRDGYGIKRILDAGYHCGFITGSKSKDIEARARSLGLQYLIDGTLDKKPAFEKVLQQSGLQAQQVAYMGDDDFDVPVLEMAGFAATVPDAMESALAKCHFVSQRPAGNGAVREVCELILNFGANSRGSS